MRWVWRIITWVLTGALVLVLAGSLWLGWASWRFRASEPMLDGAVAVAGLTADVQIIRDEFGVPHVFGDTDADVFFGLGYAHAQDRLFQMELIRRSMNGRLSEAVPAFIGGPALTRYDARQRIQGFHRTAAAIVDNFDADTRAAVEAYTAGVNAFIDGPKRRRPPEFALLMLDVEPWSPADSAAVTLYMATDLASGLSDEVATARLSDVLSQTQLAEWLAGYPDDFAPLTLSAEDLGLVEPEPEATPESIDVDPAAAPDPAPAQRAEDNPSPGSNHWVVSGERTATGKPMLANDPHLSLGAPSIWYFARLSLSDGDVVGGTVPGAPFVILGRNERIAWGFTNTGYDVIDLVPTTPDDIVATRTETIAVRLGADLQIEVRETADGPIADRDYFTLTGFDPDVPLAMKTTVDDHDNAVPNAVLSIMRARDWESFVEAGRGWTAPIQNMVYADVDGAIGYAAPGRYPRRTSDGAWAGELAFEELPLARNPGRGYIANANNQVLPGDFPHRVDGDFATFRAIRLMELIERTRLHDAASFKSMQLDVTSAQAQRLMTVIERAKPKTDLGRAVAQQLDGWDGTMDPDRVEPLIFAAWKKEVTRAVYADELGDQFAAFHGAKSVFMDRVLNGFFSQWCDDLSTDTRETCADITGIAFDRAGERLTALADQEIEVWGDAHQAYFPHPLFQGAPVLGGLFDVRTPVGGDGETLNVAHYPIRGDSFEAYHGASMRAIYDLADLDRSLFIHAPGQSGHPLSPHYKDLIGMWASGGYFEIRADWTPEAAPPGARELTLTADR